ncbi:hypothetical protein PAXRUDRAFT_627810 [Paxillus rubicundulus Ve08.2h10]|uniref:Uncharacterized protein n=1 Tax=Paxillus rubicundulus Ve08.2h10 TaxID=930991 RepID=A0A0D0DVI0_9AGAM|nr:hypothetical protein PAXRUDRAFT_627810 [Paxillus rubicundulus Ve08.2h10]
MHNLNAFLVIRAIFFAHLVYLNVLVLVFASWNIVVAKSSGMLTPGASVFLVLNSIFIFGFVSIACLARLICAKARPAHVRVECAWTVLMSTLQLAASISVTVNGPPVYCQMRSHWATCASSSLLVPVSWLATLIILTYCLTIYITSTAHATSLPSIWTTPVSAVPWFGPIAAPSQLTAQKDSKAFSSSSASDEPCAITAYIAERWEKLSGIERQSAPTGPILFSKGRQSVDSTRPAWARQEKARRGVDNPFSRVPPAQEGRATIPLPPPRAQPKEVVVPRDSHYVEVCRQSEMTSLKNNSSSHSTPQTATVFPNKISDPDVPIPLPRLSEWIRADAARGSVHTEPPFSS